MAMTLRLDPGGAIAKAAKAGMAGPSRKARCRSCRLVFLWQGLPMVRDSFCTRCGVVLHPTSHLCRDPKAEERPLDQHAALTLSTRLIMERRR